MKIGTNQVCSINVGKIVCTFNVPAEQVHALKVRRVHLVMIPVTVKHSWLEETVYC